MTLKDATSQAESRTLNALIFYMCAVFLAAGMSIVAAAAAVVIVIGSIARAGRKLGAAADWIGGA